MYVTELDVNWIKHAQTNLIVSFSLCPSPPPPPHIHLQAVNNRSLYCRCTGLSGSCVVQTCYEKSPAIEDIGSKLQPIYQGSQKVEGPNGTLHVAGSPDRNPIDGFPVYLNDSPDLCTANLEEGILGTEGRKCDPISEGANSCHNLCCNRGFKEIRYEVEQEKCKFEWCCRIVCTPLPPIEVVEYHCL